MVKIVIWLGRYAPDSLDVVNALSDMLCVDQDYEILIHSLEELQHIGAGNSRVISEITQLLEISQDVEAKCHFADCLNEVDPGNLKSIHYLAEALGVDENRDLYIIDRLSRIGADHEIIKDAFLKLIDITGSQRVRFELAWHLWCCSLCDVTIVYELASFYLFNDSDIRTCSLSMQRLKDVLQGDLLCDLVPKLAKKLAGIAPDKEFDLHDIYFDLAVFCTQKMSYSKFQQAWHQSE
jgi:hypothetical protein